MVPALNACFLELDMCFMYLDSSYCICIIGCTLYCASSVIGFVQHVPRINGEIPSVDEATLDHQRLLERYHIFISFFFQTWIFCKWFSDGRGIISILYSLWVNFYDLTNAFSSTDYSYMIWLSVKVKAMVTARLAFSA